MTGPSVGDAEGKVRRASIVRIGQGEAYKNSQRELIIVPRGRI
jgi:hypothetical protein